MSELSRDVRRANGVYYTPPPLTEHILAQTLGRLLPGKTAREAGRIRVLDPACGSGFFLLRAYRYLLDWHRERRGRRLSPAERQRILHEQIFGVDIDPEATEAAQRGLAELAGVRTTTPRLAAAIRCADALIGLDWQADFPAAGQAGGFDVVIGNPPWGQKGIAADPASKRELAQRYPSSAGIFDLFRPFVELGVRLTAPSGWFGMVLPDIVLLKDYPLTRRYLLDQLTLTAIDWWGRAFPGALIDTVTLIGRKQPAPSGHGVAVGIRNADDVRQHAIPQADFRANPRHVFNLFLTPHRRQVLDRIAACPRLGDYFAIHEGVHSGNIRAELFVATACDTTCRELLFGREEIAPYELRWQGRHVRLGVVPRQKTRQRYANLGRPEWHEREKVLVRRTGDFVLAAVDRERRYASNNFFLVFPKQSCSLDLDGLCALLNSPFLTWYFRAIEPRQGRAFAELKIKHLRSFPLPRQILQTGGCAPLNRLGAQRASGRPVDARIDRLVREWFGVSELE